MAVTSSSGHRFGLSGPLARFVTAPHWRIEGYIGPYLVLRDTRAVAPFVITSRDETVISKARVRVISQSEWSPTETVVVDSPGHGTLVRAVADIPGWHAIVVNGKRARTLIPRRHGVVQAVAIGPGRTVVTFVYDVPGLATGEALAEGGLGVIAALIVLDWVIARRRRRPNNAPNEAVDKAP